MGGGAAAPAGAAEGNTSHSRLRRRQTGILQRVRRPGIRRFRPAPARDWQHLAVLMVESAAGAPKNSGMTSTSISARSAQPDSARRRSVLADLVFWTVRGRGRRRPERSSGPVVGCPARAAPRWWAHLPHSRADFGPGPEPDPSDAWAGGRFRGDQLRVGAACLGGGLVRLGWVEPLRRLGPGRRRSGHVRAGRVATHRVAAALATSARTAGPVFGVF